MATEITLLAAFVAGVLSISSPCVLPLIPLYLGHLVGATTMAGAAPRRGAVVGHAMAFVAGFTTVFVAVGLALGAAGSYLWTAEAIAGNRFWIVRIGGVVILLLGLQQLGLIRIPGLSREWRMRRSAPSSGSLGSSYVIGAAFGAGWSPCAGPILGGILTMAAGQADPGRAATLLAIYSLGLAIPFLAVAIAGSTTAVISSLSRHMAAATAVSGAIMVAVGAIMVLGIYQQIFVRIAAAVPWTPVEPSI